MLTKGMFTVKLEPQDDGYTNAGRMIIHKSYQGGLEGSGTGQMVSKRTKNGSSVYYAIEEFQGTVDGKKGNFTFSHEGYMTKDSQSLKIQIIEGSGTEELETITGSLLIKQENNEYSYQLKYNI